MWTDCESTPQVCETLKIKLVKCVIKFCEQDKLLENEDEGMSVLLDLDDTLEALLGK